MILGQRQHGDMLTSFWGWKRRQIDRCSGRGWLVPGPFGVAGSADSPEKFVLAGVSHTCRDKSSGKICCKSMKSIKEQSSRDPGLLEPWVSLPRCACWYPCVCSIINPCNLPQILPQYYGLWKVNHSLSLHKIKRHSKFQITESYSSLSSVCLSQQWSNEIWGQGMTVPKDGLLLQRR